MSQPDALHLQLEQDMSVQVAAHIQFEFFWKSKSTLVGLSSPSSTNLIDGLVIWQPGSRQNLHFPSEHSVQRQFVQPLHSPFVISQARHTSTPVMFEQISHFLSQQLHFEQFPSQASAQNCAQSWDKVGETRNYFSQRASICYFSFIITSISFPASIITFFCMTASVLAKRDPFLCFSSSSTASVSLQPSSSKVKHFLERPLVQVVHRQSSLHPVQDLSSHSKQISWPLFQKQNAQD